MKHIPSIHIGTSGWSYKHWKDIYYPEDLSQTEWLTFYSNDFLTTEINTSFYHLPKTATTAGWAKKVTSNFIFCPKMSRYLTHMKKLNEPEESLEKFFTAFAPLKRHIGPVLIQLPPSLAFNEEKATSLYKILKADYSYYRFALEPRHNSWLTEKSISLLKKYNIAFVISQSGSRFPYGEFITAEHIYIRFHGPKELYASCYSDSQLKEFALRFQQWKKEGHSVWAFFNNDIHGYAIENGKKIKRLVGAGTVSKNKKVIH